MTGKTSDMKDIYPAHKIPLVVSVSLSFVRAPAHSGVPEKAESGILLLLLLFCGL